MGGESAQELQVPGFYEAKGRSIIRSRLTKRRVFVFPARTWAIMENTLFQRSSTGAAVILQEMGRTYGRQFGTNLKENRLSLANARKLIQSLSRGAGWGDVRIEQVDGAHINFTVRECVFCSEAGHLDLQSCHFIVGVALGIGDELLRGKAKATETRCMRTGDDACVIELSSS